MKPALVDWALQLEYDGTPFMGWQRQKHGLAIQQVFEEAAAKLCGGAVPASIVSGRTDAGVHALGQVVLVALPVLPPFRIREALNYHLKPHPIVVLQAAPAPPGWNARFSATGPHLPLCHLQPAGPAGAAREPGLARQTPAGRRINAPCRPNPARQA